MRKFTALWQREFIEHRGAFFWAPVAILGIFILTVASVVTRARFDFPAEVLFLPPRRLYEDGMLVAFLMWWVFFAAALFFYLADAFSADRRNNAMLFWKSMPVSDFGMLTSKITFGMAASAAFATVYTAATGLFLGIVALFINFVIPSLAPPSLPDILTSFISLTVFAAGYSALSVFWYLPFLAWVGALSTIVRRWSIPLAFFIPGAITLMEASVFRTTYVGTFIQERLQFGFDWPVIAGMFTTLVPLSGNDLLAIVLLGVDWWQLGGGIAVAIVLVYLASRYRRRGIAS